jgi:hypothetical protein
MVCDKHRFVESRSKVLWVEDPLDSGGVRGGKLIVGKAGGRRRWGS